MKKKLIGILLSLALVVTMMPVCSFADSTIDISGMRFLTPVCIKGATQISEEDPFTFTLQKGVSAQFVFAKGTETKQTWISPTAKDFKVYKITYSEEGNEVKTLVESSPFTITSGSILDVPKTKGFTGKPKLVNIKFNKFTSVEGELYLLKYTGKYNNKALTEGVDGIYLQVSTFDNTFYGNVILASTKVNVGIEDIFYELDPTTGEKYYLYDCSSGTPEYWKITPKYAHIYNENNKEVTGNFTIAQDKDNGNAVYVKTDKKIAGYYQLRYANGKVKGTMVFGMNTWDVVDVAKATTSTVTAKVAKKKVTLSLKRSGKYSQDGYQVYRSTKQTSGFKKIASTTKSSYVDKTVKAKKTYYYKVRTYKLFNGKYYYGQWSKVIKVKAK